MGLSSGSYGYISNFDFVIATNYATLVVAMLLALFVKLRLLNPEKLSQFPAIIMLGLGIILGANGIFSALPSPLSGIVPGVICGFAIVVLCVVWMKIAFDLGSMRMAVFMVMAGFCLKQVLVGVLENAHTTFIPYCAMGLLALSALICFWLERQYPKRETVAVPADDRYAFIRACICLYVLIGIVGIQHTTVLGSSAEGVIAGIDVDLAATIAVAFSAVCAFFMGWHVGAVGVAKVIFPALFVAVSFLPFLGEQNGVLVSFFTIFCYETYGTLFVLYLVCECYRLGCSPFYLSCAYIGGRGGALALGLSLGVGLNLVSADYDFSLLTVLSCAAMYPIALVMVFVYRRKTEHKKPEGTANGIEGVVEANSALDDVCDAIARDCALTKREREILAYLARGHSAKHIASELHISENTAWVHIKNVYSKTGVHGKQEIINEIDEKRRQLESDSGSH